MNLRPPGVKDRPLPKPGETWDDYLARMFPAVVDSDGMTIRYLICQACGSHVEPGWQATHYQEAHGFKGF